MTTITETPCATDSRSAVDDPLFLAPPTTDELKTPPRVSDRGEQVMQQLRHPFASR
jgi:hypothetical protein